MGNLDNVWLTVPENPNEEELRNAFQSYFGAKWEEVLDTADNSFAYNLANNAYFAVRELHLVDNQIIDQILKDKGNGPVGNIIAS